MVRHDPLWHGRLGEVRSGKDGLELASRDVAVKARNGGHGSDGHDLAVLAW